MQTPPLDVPPLDLLHISSPPDPSPPPISPFDYQEYPWSRYPVARGASLNFRPPSPKKEKTPEPQTRGRKKCITKFSSRSARTLSNLFASINWQGAYFLTLTQKPGLTPQAAKIALTKGRNSFASQLKDYFPRASFVWRLEKQKNGSPHFHLVIFCPGDAEETLLELVHWSPSKVWQRAIKGDYIPQVTTPVFLRKNRAAYLYLVGHGTKKNQTWFNGENPGRYWGVFNKKNVPFYPQQEIFINEDKEKFLQKLWERHEQKRVTWLKQRYQRDVLPREWGAGPLKFYPWPIFKVLRAYDWLNKKS